MHPVWTTEENIQWIPLYGLYTTTTRLAFVTCQVKHYNTLCLQSVGQFQWNYPTLLCGVSISLLVILLQCDNDMYLAYTVMTI